MLFLKVAGRLLNRFFSGVGRFLMGFFRWVGKHEMFLGIITVAFLVIFGIWLVLSLLNINIVIGQPPAVVAGPVQAQAVEQATPTPEAAPTPLPIQKTDAPPATEAFMRGQVNGNADQVWDALNANLHNQLAGLGRDKSYFQRLFDSQRKSGIVYDSYQYVGGVPAENGTSIHFYVMTIIGNDKQKTRIPWTFVVDNKDGKIVSADFPSS